MVMRCKLLECQAWLGWALVITAVGCNEMVSDVQESLSKFVEEHYSTQTVVKRHSAPYQTWFRETYEVLENEF